MIRAIAIFSFNRPDILEKCLTSMKIPTGCDVHLFQDGAINPHSRSIKCHPSLVNQCKSVFESTIPNGSCHMAQVNMGIALNHLRAYEYIFEEKKYDQCVFFDDDTVLTNVQALFNMCERTRNISDVMGADTLLIPYKHASSEEQVILCDPWKYHIDFKSFACCRDKYMTISELYKKKINEFCYGVDYTTRDTKKIQEYLGHEFGSQDWIRDRCFREFGMTKKAITSRPMAKNIGEHGTHADASFYAGCKYNETVPEEVTGDGEIVQDTDLVIHVKRDLPYQA